MVKYLLPPIQYREFDNNGDPLAGGKVYTYVAGTVSTPKTSYTDSTGATPNANPVILDSAGAADIWIDGSYKIKVTDANDVLIREEDNINNDQGAQGPSGTFQMSLAGGTADAITASYDPAVTLTDLTTVGFRAINTNATTTPTFSPNGLTAHTITNHNGDALLAGDIIAGGEYFVTYDSANTRWKMVTSSSHRSIKLYQVNNGITVAAPTSTVTPYQLTLPTAIGSGGFLSFDGSGVGSFTTPSTGAVTLVVEKTATAAGSVQFTSSDLGAISGKMYMIEIRGAKPSTNANLRLNLRTVASGIFNLVTVSGLEAKSNTSSVVYQNASGVIATDVQGGFSSGIAPLYGRIWLPVNISGSYVYGRYETNFENNSSGNTMGSGMFFFNTSSSNWDGFSLEWSTGNFSTSPAAVISVYRFSN